MSIPIVGEPAPDFTLPDESGAPRALSEQRGRWVVLYFYPTDDTPGCTTEACEFRDANDDLLARNAVVWGVSPQGSASKSRFKRKHDLPFTLLADEGHAVADTYGTWIEKSNYGKTYWGTSRTTFLVDPNGRVARVWPKVTPRGHAAEVLATLDGVSESAPAPSA